MCLCRAVRVVCSEVESSTGKVKESTSSLVVFQLGFRRSSPISALNSKYRYEIK